MMTTNQFAHNGRQKRHGYYQRVRSHFTQRKYVPVGHRFAPVQNTAGKNVGQEEQDRHQQYANTPFYPFLISRAAYSDQRAYYKESNKYRKKQTPDSRFPGQAVELMEIRNI